MSMNRELKFRAWYQTTKKLQSMNDIQIYLTELHLSMMM
jgi:hypothetical protein